ncbi:hypothetical protein IGI04_009184 [Brassica rapa subsp. trilocularis]|uniref:ER membrane protein complex subunit 1 n=1 Tax=Brassica rapa subsp. trilocularis TaxID=1813537 RepID=A0ABQ7MWJ2_BRACM|nr:hypothetical protein IGI04_009184 [Brassica rapa subsp. trilocularis]
MDSLTTRDSLTKAGFSEIQCNFIRRRTKITEVFTKSQSYFFLQSVKTIAVTSTAKGITSKQLLIGTIGDQILALGKRFVDPRWTLNPSQAEKEKEPSLSQIHYPSLLRSGAILGLVSVRAPKGLRGIVTAPAKLESTTHVFAYEVDLFYTRLACSFKDLRLADRRFQLRTSLDYNCSPRCSYIHHLIPFREEGTKRKIEVTGTGSF